MDSHFTVYMIDCKRPRTLYVGMTQNFAQRKHKHLHTRSSIRSGFLRTFGVKHVWPIKRVATRAEAYRLEYELTQCLRKRGYFVKGSEYPTGIHIL